jgi:beta-lactamase regulating signal transducer with metallopeptidase domain/tetratricopeptide (TPR) repeat protein
MLHLVWVGALVGCLGLLARRLSRQARPETRHALALLLLAGLGLAPALIFRRVYEPAERPTIRIASPSRARRDAASLPVSLDQAAKDAEFKPQLSSDRRPVAATPSRLEAIVAYLPAFWATGSIVTLLWLCAGFMGVERLRRSGRVLADGEAPRCARRLAESLAISRRFGLAVCDRIAGPILIGIVRPLILLPPAALSGWSPEQLEMVLLHELAHLRRHDNLVNLFQRFAESLLFFHPATWWLSGWLRLERELCCDRVVIEHLGARGAPRAYAELLFLLAGSGERGFAMAMAERHVMTRIRRILNLEDRSMKLTMPEGVGLLGALLVGASLVVGSSAAPPPKEANGGLRRALRKATEDAASLPPETNVQGESREIAMLGIAESQLKLGDREAALANYDRVLGAILERIEARKYDLQTVGALVLVITAQRRAGELDAARRSLDRITRAVRTLEPVPMRQELVQITGVAEQRREEFEVGRLAVSAMLVELAGEHIELGRPDEARPLFERALALIQPEKGIMKPMILCEFGARIHQAGDAVRARELLDEARRLAEGLSDPKDRNGALPYVAASLACTGQLHEAFEVIRSLDGPGRASSLEKLLEAMSDDRSQNQVPWFDAGSIKIMIGAEWFTPKDPAQARIVLPRIAEAVRQLGDPVQEARVLSMIAGMQARAGEVATALTTAASIPALGPKDHRTPADGFYEAIKPGTLAILAGVAASKGDDARALDALRDALALAREIESPGEKIVAQIVIARQMIERGDTEPAHGLLFKTVVLAREQAEPRRSRSLAMLSECQLKAGDVDEATCTMEATRDYPGLEKARALSALADWHEAKGDREAAHALLRRSLAYVEAPKPANASMGKPQQRLQAIAARTFIDPMSELEDPWLKNSREMNSVLIRVQLGDIDSVLRRIEKEKSPQRGLWLNSICGQLARQGEMDRALSLIDTLKTPQERLEVLQVTAFAVANRDGIVRR